jgi:hypothetical protein
LLFLGAWMNIGIFKDRINWEFSLRYFVGLMGFFLSVSFLWFTSEELEGGEENRRSWFFFFYLRCSWREREDLGAFTSITHVESKRRPKWKRKKKHNV